MACFIETPLDSEDKYCADSYFLMTGIFSLGKPCTSKQSKKRHVRKLTDTYYRIESKNRQRKLKQIRSIWKEQKNKYEFVNVKKFKPVF